MSMSSAATTATSRPGETMHPRTPRDEGRTVLVLREHDSVWAPSAKAGVLADAEAIHNELAQAGYHVVPVQIQSPSQVPTLLKPFDPARCIVLNWHEGVESGAHDAVQVAALLDEMWYTYTGAGTLTLQMTQDKLRAMRLLRAHGIPSPNWQSLAGNDCGEWDSFPAIIKLASEHGSECLTAESVVHDDQALRARAADLKAQGHEQLMVSEFVDGREFTVSLWGNGPIDALPLIEIDYSDLPPALPRLRTYDAKWVDSSDAYQRTRLVRPQNLSRQVSDRILRVARDTYRAFGLRDFGRIDIRMRDGIPFVIDVNSNPDITAGSSFVTAAEFGGYDYPAMLDRIVRLAIARADTMVPKKVF